MKALYRSILILCLSLSALTGVVLLSHITWFPGLLQIIANNLDPHQFYQLTDEDYLTMIEDEGSCFRNVDCEFVCTSYRHRSDCNSSVRNIYSDKDLLCTAVGCPPRLFTVAVCHDQRCIIRGF